LDWTYKNDSLLKSIESPKKHQLLIFTDTKGREAIISCLQRIDSALTNLLNLDVIFGLTQSVKILIGVALRENERVLDYTSVDPFY